MKLVGRRSPTLNRAGRNRPSDFRLNTKAVAVERQMKFRELETVVLERDIPKHGLRKGDLLERSSNSMSPMGWKSNSSGHQEDSSASDVAH